MKTKFASLLIAVLFLASVFAGAASGLEIHALSVKPFDANTPAPDQMLISGTESHTWVGDSSTKEHTFYLPHGTYDLTVKKAGYTDFVYRSVVVNDQVDTDGITNIYYTLTAVPTQQPPSGQQGTTQPGTQISTLVFIKDFDFEDEATPGQDVTFTAEVKNTETFDAENVELTVTLKSIVDNEDDVEETADFGTIEKSDSEEATLTLTVPRKVDAKTYTVETKLTWENTEGTEFSTTRTDSLKVTKEDHDIIVTSVTLAPTAVDAGRSGQLAVSLWNAGKNDETVRIKVESPDLKLSAMSAQFKFKENAETTQYVPFTTPTDARDGKYFVYVTVFFENGAQNVLETTTLEVKAPASAAKDAVTVTPIVVTSGTTETAKPVNMAVAIIAAILVIAGVIALLVKEYAPIARPQIVRAKR